MRTSSATALSVAAVVIGGAACLVSVHARAQTVPDFDGDGYADLAVGVMNDIVDGIEGAGAVNVIYGSQPVLPTALSSRPSPHSLNANGNQLWHQNSPGILGDSEEEDWFGASLAWGDFDGDGYTDLAIGAPREDLLFTTRTGIVHVIYGSSAGLTADGSQVWHQDSPGILNVSEQFDQFGSNMTAGDYNGDGFADLAVGVPLEDVSGVGDAGAVNVIYGSPAGLTADGNQLWHQNSPFVRGTSQSGDHFGSSLATGDFDGNGFADLAIGVPGEGGVPDAGAVSVIYGSAAGLTANGDQRWHQNSLGIPGTSEEGDGFGKSLAAGDFDADGYADLAIGVPREDLDDIEGAGTVYVIYGSIVGLASAGRQLWHQNSSGIRGAAEEGDFFGNSLATGDFNGDGRADLAIGASSEGVNGEQDMGAVHVIFGTPAGLTAGGDQFWHQDSPGIQGDGTDFDEWARGVAAADFNGDGFADLAVSAPIDSEMPGAHQMSGVVNVIYGSSDGLTADGNQIWHQDSPSILGVAEDLDGFGSPWAGLPVFP